MQKMMLIEHIAHTLAAIKNCEKQTSACSNEPQRTWLDRHYEAMSGFEALLPHGSGIDDGTRLDRVKSTDERIVFDFGYHHMDVNGYYDGWTTHQLIVKPSFIYKLDMRLTGPNRNQIKDYLHEVYYTCLTQEIER